MVVETFPFAPLVGDPVKKDFPTSQERDSVADPPGKRKWKAPTASAICAGRESCGRWRSESRARQVWSLSVSAR